MILNFVIWVCYILGLQKRSSATQSGNTVTYRVVSFAPLDFFVGVAGTLLFGLCALICIIIFLYAIANDYNASVAISYVFATVPETTNQHYSQNIRPLFRYLL